MTFFPPVVGVFAAATALAAPAAPPQACAPIRVMTYNILESYDVPSERMARWSLRRDDLIRQLQTSRPSILGMQEVTPIQKADLEHALPGYAFVGVAREDGHSGGESNNIAIDRGVFDIQSSGTFWLSPTPEVPSKGWDAGFKRIATWAHLVRRSDGRRLLILNTHLDSNGRQARIEGAQVIVRWLLANRKPDEAIIVTGDMNSGPKGLPIQELTSPELGLRDSRLVTRSKPSGPEATMNGLEGGRVTARIDFVLVDPSIDVEHYAVPGGRPASDHNPVIVDVGACRP